MEVVTLKRSGQNWVKACDERPVKAARGRADNSPRTGSYAASTQSRTAGAGTYLCSDSPHAAARSVLHDAERHTQNLGARLGTQHVSVGDVQVIARDGDIEIVLERQSD